jgi:hypothetical protein
MMAQLTEASPSVGTASPLSREMNSAFSKAEARRMVQAISLIAGKNFGSQRSKPLLSTVLICIQYCPFGQFSSVLKICGFFRKQFVKFLGLFWHRMFSFTFPFV